MAVVRETDSMLRIVRRIETRAASIIMCLSLMQTYLEYSVEFWSLHCTKNVGKLEKVQKKDK